MARLFLLLLVVISSCSVLANVDPMLKRFEKWMSKHGRFYEDTQEKERRFWVYQNNVQLIEKFNSMSKDYKLIDNKFADMTNEEFRAKMLGFGPRDGMGQISDAWIPQEPTMDMKDVHEGNDTLPTSIDWREKGAVVPVKNQGACGSCWAFSAVAAMEGINQIKNGKLVSLSEQELVDCDSKAVGCMGGYMSWAFEFVMENHGLASEVSYPYEGVESTCQEAKLDEKTVTIAGYKNVTPNNEPALQTAAAMQPVSVAIDAGSFTFQFYNEGVYTGPCTNMVNHGVTLVGYGEADDKGKYWIVKNSWGPEWGDEGYVLMQRDVPQLASGICGITLFPSYPVM